MMKRDSVVFILFYFGFWFFFLLMFSLQFCTVKISTLTKYPELGTKMVWTWLLSVLTSILTGSFIQRRSLVFFLLSVALLSNTSECRMLLPLRKNSETSQGFQSFVQFLRSQWKRFMSMNSACDTRALTEQNPFFLVRAHLENNFMVLSWLKLYQQWKYFIFT